MIQDLDDIQSHVHSFYKALFIKHHRGGIALADNILSAHQYIYLEDNNALLAPFDEAEVKAFIKLLNPASTPGLERPPVSFFQVFWSTIKEYILATFDLT